MQIHGTADFVHTASWLVARCHAEAMQYRTLNPATEELIETYPLATTDEIDQGLQDAHRAFLEWRATRLEQRAKPMLAVAELLEKRAAELAQLMALEMGKPLAEGEAEAKKCALGCRHYAEHADEYLREDPLGPPMRARPWCATTPWDRCWRSCPGTCRSGSSTASPR
jgi:succinate-semialdehyde dehydrogenase/glutarate-semialdehyde dehydrogenase